MVTCVDLEPGNFTRDRDGSRLNGRTFAPSSPSVELPLVQVWVEYVSLGGFSKGRCLLDGGPHQLLGEALEAWMEGVMGLGRGGANTPFSHIAALLKLGLVEPLYSSLQDLPSVLIQLLIIGT